MPADAALLAEIPFFHFLDDGERVSLATQLEEVQVPEGQILFNYGEPGDCLYVIRSGKAEVFFKDDTGTRIVLEVAGSGDVVGELSLLDGGPRTASVVVTEKLDALRLDRADLDQFLRTHPAAAIDLMSSMGRRLRVSAERLRHTASRNVNVAAEDKRTTVQKAADWIADFSGSIPFLLLHVAFFAAWILLNVPRIPGAPMFDPFPYGLLTMVVSLEAIILSVFVLLSQNRQVAKERIRSDIEYEVNIKAEMEVAHLHEKVDLLNANTADTAARIRHLERLIERRPGS
ncbi:MAG: cyclic nucleotide-binding protein [Acidobacteria bacterium]|nr:MAG: cyclic nucleotide-binding protein [Acidobacteriota bacterium]